ncbi:RluA family pseudouridine synthase [Pontivivens insulae]|uniref:Ribosomal large subunit pseudouridine synthase A n=1 Tax=Pontivivens insulae TaxID=1639689 RepID=A0A2R8AF39_9RHOB|nr:RluA family pseudouridine synthase [Pontivivens insulae]RED12051.1 ribosomal large subunit pseudouridine synthase A [Pontivivens insulae]SPF30807.1 Ribosomal large subunit pseudouridine synthase A [Pontivivens insulae]
MHIHVNIKPPPLEDYHPPQGPLCVVHEDEALLLVDKPSGLLSVPGKGAHLADCLEARVRAAYPEALLIHRLDMDTSGLMVFARSPLAQRHLNWQFEKRTVHKRYQALVEGRVAGQAGFVDLPLIADWPNRPLQMVDFERGKPSLTHWSVLDRGRDWTRLDLRPKTGRSHQLRVHCLAMGHRIVGDPFYGGDRSSRLMLHAHSLTLRHPIGGAWRIFECKVPF